MKADRTQIKKWVAKTGRYLTNDQRRNELILHVENTSLLENEVTISDNMTTLKGAHEY